MWFRSVNIIYLLITQGHSGLRAPKFPINPATCQTLKKLQLTGAMRNAWPVINATELQGTTAGPSSTLTGWADSPTIEHPA